MADNSVYQEDIKNLYRELEQTKIEVAVMKSEANNNYKNLLEKIEDLFTMYKSHCDKAEIRAKQKSGRVWGIKQTLITGTAMLIIAALFELVKKHL